VALDRQSIARSDFPAARRGYDPGAVDRHLAAIADEVEELRRRTAGPGAALAAQTSDQVRSIIEAAESSAAGMRDSAAKDARAHVERVAEAADALRERIDALERELTGMLGTLRGGADRLRSELEAVADGTARLAAAGEGGVPAEVAPSALGATLGEAAKAGPADAEVGEEPALAAVEEAPAKPAGRSTDVLGARIVALQWATEGRPREETDRHLAEHFDLPDRAAVLEAAYARVAKT
jgi:cell division septum initiation protein DivIVA